MTFNHDNYSRLRLCTIAAALLLALTTQAVPQEDKIDASLAPPTASGDKIDNVQLERLKRSRAKNKKVDIFQPKSWYVPPPPPPPVAPPPPSAPPLPYTFMGKIIEPQGKLTIFLANGDKLHLVSTGETLDDTYSVDSIENGKLTLTYLPLKIKQYINLGETP
jgi:hypothetical protein